MSAKKEIKWKPDPVWPEVKYEYITDPASEVPVAFEGDVAVIGGGTAGVVAAIAAAREGAKTVVIERLGALGGVPVTDLMGSCGSLYQEGYGLVMKGISYEIFERVMKAGGTKHANMRDMMHGKDGIPFTVPFKPEVMGKVMTEMVQESGAKIMLHTHFSHILGPEERPTGAVVVNKSGRQAILANSFVDASGDCDFMRAANVPVTRMSSRWGFLFRMVNVDFDRVIEFLGTVHPWDGNPGFMTWLSKTVGVPVEDLPCYSRGLWGGISDPLPYNHQPGFMLIENKRAFRQNTLDFLLNRWEKDGFIYNFEHRLLRDQIRKAVDAGDIVLEKEIPGFGKIHFNWDGFAIGAWGPGIALVNGLHVSWFDPTNADHVTRAEIESRARALITANFYKKYIPGFENAEILDMGQQTVSRYGIFIDSVGDYDHEKQKTDQGDTIALMPNTPEGPKAVHRIPFSMLVPKKIENALAAGKCAGNAQPVRGIPMCFGMGQAAGTAAALIANSGVNVREIDIKQLQTRLKAQGVILRPEDGEKLT